MKPDYLAKLYALRAQADDKIRAELASRARIDRLRERLDPVDPFDGDINGPEGHIRKWAHEKGIYVAAMGRVSAVVKAQYEHAHRDEAVA